MMVDGEDHVQERQGKNERVVAQRGLAWCRRRRGSYSFPQFGDGAGLLEVLENFSTNADKRPIL